MKTRNVIGVIVAATIISLAGIAIVAAGPPLRKIQSVSLEGAAILGNQDAPVTIIEFADFQCPFCHRFSSETLPQLQKEYIDSGKVKFVYKHFPLRSIHPNAEAASLAAECAHEQAMFWEYHGKLYSTQTDWENQDSTSATATFKKYAADMGLNADQFNYCLDSNKYQSKIDKEAQEASSLGVSATPTFYVGNGKIGYISVEGARPYATFKQVIDQQLHQTV